MFYSFRFPSAARAFRVDGRLALIGVSIEEGVCDQLEGGLGERRRTMQTP